MEINKLERRKKNYNNWVRKKGVGGQVRWCRLVFAARGWFDFFFTLLLKQIFTFINPKTKKEKKKKKRGKMK